MAALGEVKVLFSLGAGVDGIDFSLIPEHLPVVRMVEPALSHGMQQYLVHRVIDLSRHFWQYRDQQQEGRWLCHEHYPGGRRVSFLGWGNMVRPAALTLAAMGYTVRAWRRGHAIDEGGVRVVSAADGPLTALLAETDILVNVLPLTVQTRHIINAETLSALPAKASLVNAGRGGHVDEAALLDALDRGHLQRAVLDVFAEEPLPAAHRFWTHPSVDLSPHIASLTDPESAMAYVWQQIQRFEAGQPLQNVVDRQRAY
ncbi:unnamed protein product [Cyprideis torosa]|uniref:Uncharacterized protein n=1 Tax=Cyprideis torosa TaxID=163714 RepID=A0A7R8ZZI5_9CRUS|nr:unnamed protein product [Cyprideis torosa]CAG0909878.1 unnamed protein product [Cyprideis torosa]